MYKTITKGIKYRSITINRWLVGFHEELKNENTLLYILLQTRNVSHNFDYQLFWNPNVVYSG